jgi:predicted transposase YbfD/YdcC
MKLRAKSTIKHHFSAIKDPRVERSKRHLLIDIITLTLCAVIGGAETWEDIELYGKCKYKWFKKFLKLPNGIPSHDTFNRVFARLDPEQLQRCFLNWVKSISSLIEGEIIAIDGKTLRRSHDKNNNQKAIVMVSAWAQQQGLVLGQRKVDSKSNEITAIPELLRVLYLKGAIVTIDAIGCQKEIVSTILEKEANYLITVKKNQRLLYEEIEALFKQALKTEWAGGEHSQCKLKQAEHGRQETRFYRSLTNLDFSQNFSDSWSQITSLGMAEYMRVEKNGRTTIERRYYISSLTLSAKEFSRIIRGHWSIENQLHWVLDVAFHEDSSKVRKDNAPENLAIIRHIALNLLKQDRREKGSIRSKRNRAGWDNDYLLSLIINS